MAEFDLAGGLNSVTSTVQQAAGAAAGVLNTAARLGSAITNLSNPGGLASVLRSINLPLGGEAIGSIINASAAFGGTDATSDWRARLSMPKGTFFDSSPILAPLNQAGGLIFPYTPTISISSNATYNEIPVTHQNYQFQAYQNSRVNEIQITGEFNVEDAVQAKYWIAVVHFLRAVTKMYTGDTAFQGNPPPILNFSAYGDHVFRNVPVVVKSFSMSLPKDVQYISTNVGIGDAGGISSVAVSANSLAGVAGSLGAGATASALGQVAGAASAISSVQNLFGGAGGAGIIRDSHVPVKSDLTISIMPVYSRESVRQFSLQQFVNGAYVSKGYI